MYRGGVLMKKRRERSKKANFNLCFSCFDKFKNCLIIIQSKNYIIILGDTVYTEPKNSLKTDSSDKSVVCLETPFYKVLMGSGASFCEILSSPLSFFPV